MAPPTQPCQCRGQSLYDRNCRSIAKQLNYSFGLTSVPLGAGSRLWLSKHLSCVTSTVNLFFLKHGVFPSHQSPALQEMAVFYTKYAVQTISRLPSPGFSDHQLPDIVSNLLRLLP